LPIKIKIKRRYLALKIDSFEKISSKDFINALWEAVLRLFGEYGASKTGMTLIDYDEEKGYAIIRVALKQLEKVRASIASITNVQSKPAAIHVLKVSGTLRSLRENKILNKFQF
jgi:RNase P/RNase MRP subunit POP5